MKTFPTKQLRELQKAPITRILVQQLGYTIPQMRQKIEQNKANLEALLEGNPKLLSDEGIRRLRQNQDELLHDLSVVEQYEEGKAAALMAPSTNREALIFEWGPKWLFEWLPVDGPRLLAEEMVQQLVGIWYATLQDSYARAELKTAAKRNLEGMGKALARVGSGRTEQLTEKEKEDIVAACRKWRPICEGLNKEFKEMSWKEKKLEVSKSRRKEVRRHLAEKYHIPTADVEAIEWILEQSSGKKRKSTPTRAMCHMVAREFRIGEKTVETVWRDHLKSHPEESRKRRKSLTTPVAEKTS